MKTSRLLLSALLAAGLSGAALAKDGPLTGTSQAFEDAVRRGDTAAVGAMYADNGEILPPNEKRVRGPAEIAKYYGGMIGMGLSLKLSVDTEVVDGKLGFKSGTYIVNDKDGKEVEHGKWVEVWQFEDGKWRMIRDIWNSDVPAPAPTPAAAEAPPPTSGVSSDKE